MTFSLLGISLDMYWCRWAAVIGRDQFPFAPFLEPEGKDLGMVITMVPERERSFSSTFALFWDNPNAQFLHDLRQLPLTVTGHQVEITLLHRTQGQFGEFEYWNPPS